MLDDLEFISKLDRSNILGVIAGQPQQLQQQFAIEGKTFKPFKNVVLAGMGGSALAGDFITTWLEDRLSVPFVIVRDYSLPAFAGEDTLLIAASYSGNTEETLEALAQAKERGCEIVVISHGGKIKEIAESKGYPYLQIPSVSQPRLGTFFSAKAIAAVFEAAGVAEGLTRELEEVGAWAETQTGQWTSDTETNSNQAKQIAEELFGHIVVVYGGQLLGNTARKWKIDFNENAKSLAFSYALPEFSHNEFNGWLFPKEKPVKVVELVSSLDHPQVQKRFEITNRLLSGNMPKPIIVNAVGETRLQQMIWTMLLGGFVSAYVAFLNGIDPTPVDLVERLKKELA